MRRVALLARRSGSRGAARLSSWIASSMREGSSEWGRLAEACGAEAIAGVTRRERGDSILSVFFSSGSSAEEMATVARTLRGLGSEIVVGCGAGHGVIGARGEVPRGLSVLSASVGCETFVTTRAALPEMDWEGAMRDAPGGILLFSSGAFDVESLASRLDLALPRAPKIGGACDALCVDGTVYEHAAVGIMLRCRVDPVVSQGALPVGRPMRVDAVQPGRPFVTSIDGLDVSSAFRRAISRDDLPPGARLFIGVKVDPRAVDAASPSHEDAFVVRHVGAVSPAGVFLPVDPDLLVPGATLQFHAFGPDQAKAELHRQLQDRPRADAALLATCLGRGANLYDTPNLEPDYLKTHALTTPTLAGFAANGEIGPCGHRTYLHAYTAATALLSRPPP